MECWITSQAAAAAHMSLQTSSGLAWCLGPHALPRIHSLSLALRVGMSWGISERFQTVINLKTTQGLGCFIRRGIEPQRGFFTHGHMAHYWEPRGPLQGPPHCPASQPT